jgi:hypothetical protein
MHTNRLIGYAGKGRLDTILHRPDTTLRLDLPAVKTTAIVFNSHRDSHHLPPSVFAIVMRDTV